MSRILRAVNALILLVVLGAIGGVFWWVWLPTPKTSGEIQAPTAKPVRIARDGLGIPHIFAENIDDAIFAQGFATAQDRLWQMDTLRRLAAGELSEIIGKPGLELDRKSRRLRMRQIAQGWMKNLPAKDRAVLAAYARGVNHYIETNRGRWSPEFALLGYQPRPWLISDSLLCALQMHRTLSGHWEQDLLKARMLAHGDRDKVEFLFPDRIGDEPMPGSNAWAISGARTTTGKPVLANDPHLEWTLPSTWYEIQLQAPGMNVVGVSLPGVPAVVIGHNDKIAWGITALQFDNQDLYVENIDVRTGVFTYKGQSGQAHREVELIAVKGGRPVEEVIYSTIHGPIIQSEGGVQLSLRWAAATNGPFEFPLLDLDRARNWTEFRAALSKLAAPNVNVMYADTDGNIGWQVVGRLPIRKGFRGDVPLNGSSGMEEWAGYIPFDQLPSYFNPKSGLLVSANQNGFPADTPYQVNGFFASTQRARQIEALLRSRPKWRPEEMLRIQTDIYASNLKYLADQAVRAVEKRGDQNEFARAGVQMLKNWNGQMNKDSAAPVLASLLFQHLRRSMADRAAPKESADYKPYIAHSVVEKLVATRPKGWFNDYDLWLATSLADAVEEGRRMQGRNLAKWRYGTMNQLRLIHPVANMIPFVSSFYNVGTVPMDGSGSTIKATTERLGPSMRFVADTSNWDASLMNLTVGESGHFFSWHYKDQWEHYYNGQSFPLEFGRTKAKGTLTLRP
ncbi:penicillin acylase family protein [uncultured Paludibaculum sp.]|uniref:penicillin acylase family protein n=1 Tax=uncultured Paludibaculum sp. TaxID=1765020 RepID=UPI002AAA7DC9|nr:penicillin acylase family protein [uncultured Paludibaculum sp.]